jgi:hypothetical protein
MKAAVFEATKKPLVVKDLPDPECTPTVYVAPTGTHGLETGHGWASRRSPAQC